LMGGVVAPPPAPTCLPAIVGPPVANAGSPQIVASGATVTLDGTGSTDPNGLPLTYHWTQIDGPVVLLSSATSATPFFTAPVIPSDSPSVTLTFQLVVSDAALASTPSMVAVTVNASPTTTLAPIANAGAAQTVGSNQTVHLNGTASVDPNVPAQPLTYAWTQISPLTPVPTLTGADTATPTFVAPTVAAPGQTFTFMLTVTNTSGLGSQSTVDVRVNPPLAPIAIVGPNQTVPSASTVTLDGSASKDPQGLPLTYQWGQASGPPVTLVGANTAKPTFVAPTVAPFSSPVSLVFVLQVSNGYSTSLSAAMNVTVQPGTDTIVITSAIYKTSRQRLTVNAADQTVTNGSATLYLQPLTAGGVPLQMTNNGNGTYTITVTGVPAPTFVTVKSSLGGTATGAVTIQ
jgi:chitinase